MRPDRREYPTPHDPDEGLIFMCYLLYGVAVGILTAWLLLP